MKQTRRLIQTAFLAATTAFATFTPAPARAQLPSPFAHPSAAPSPKTAALRSYRASEIAQLRRVLGTQVRIDGRVTGIGQDRNGLTWFLYFAADHTAAATAAVNVPPTQVAGMQKVFEKYVGHYIRVIGQVRDVQGNIEIAAPDLTAVSTSVAEAHAAESAAAQPSAPPALSLANLEPIRAAAGKVVTIRGTINKSGERKKGTVRWLRFSDSPGIALTFEITPANDAQFSAAKLSEFVGQTVRATGTVMLRKDYIDIQVNALSDIETLSASE